MPAIMTPVVRPTSAMCTASSGWKTPIKYVYAGDNGVCLVFFSM